VKRHDECALDHYVTYQASSYDLPATFDDGSCQFGTADAVSLSELVPNVHVQISLRYVATTVDVRLSHRYLSVSIVSPPPDSLVDDMGGSGSGSGAPARLHAAPAINPLELCTARCPKRHVVDIRSHLMAGSNTRGVVRGGGDSADLLLETSSRSALSVCRSVGLVDSYLDSCVYDLVMTGGDGNLTALTRHACDEARLLGLLKTNRTHLLDSHGGGEGGGVDVTSAANVLHVRHCRRPQSAVNIIVTIAIVLVLSSH